MQHIGVQKHFKESLQKKDVSLQPSISSASVDNASEDQSKHQPPSEATGQIDISKMKWKEGKNAPGATSRGASVIHGNIVYLSSSGSRKVYSYQNIHGEGKWSNPNESHGLVVVDGL